MSYLKRQAEAAVLNQDVASIQTLIAMYAKRNNWSPETLRVRWDGISAFLDWMCTLADINKPPLHNLTKSDAQAFIQYLESKKLAKSTIKGYKRGADVLTKVVRAATAESLELDRNYHPFDGVSIKPKQISLLKIDEDVLQHVYPLKTRAKLKVLIALHNLGLTTSELSLCRWKDVNLLNREILSYDYKRYPTSLAFIASFTEYRKFFAATINTEARLLGWKPSTIRQWMKFLRVNMKQEIKA